MYQFTDTVHIVLVRDISLAFKQCKYPRQDRLPTNHFESNLSYVSYHGQSYNSVMTVSENKAQLLFCKQGANGSSLQASSCHRSPHFLGGWEGGLSLGMVRESSKKRNPLGPMINEQASFQPVLLGKVCLKKD